MKAPMLLRVFTVLASVGALVLGGLFAYEALLLGPLATPERVAEYRFGSGAMVGNGGIAYKSRASYLLFTAAPALLLFASAGIGVVGSIRSKKYFCLVSLLCIAIGFAFFMWGGG